MATQGVPLWSTTASSNANADPAVNMAEGMAPSAVNDSCRAMMASVAKWRNDLYGITTGGTSTAYTITTAATYASASDMSGAVFTIIPNATNGASPTLAVDGLTARAINQSTGVAVATAALVSGTPYLVKYVHASTEFILLGRQAVYPTLTIASGLTLTAGQYTSPVGSVGAPTYTFVGDLDCGMYRIGANNIGLAVNGAKVVDIGTAGVAFTGTGSFTSTLTASSGFTVSAGSVSLPAGSIAVAALASSPRVLLATLTASNSASLADTTHLTSAYTRYEIVFTNILPATNNVQCQLKINSGGVKSTGYTGTVQYTTTNSDAGTTFIPCSRAALMNSGVGVSGIVTIFDPAQTASPKPVLINLSYRDNSFTGTQGMYGAYSWDGGNGAVTGIEVSMSSGNITSGTIKIYGIP